MPSTESASRLRLKLVSDDLLRKPSTAVQTRRMRALADDLTEQARDQVRSRGRRPFRGEVAVEIDLHATGVQQPAASPPAVKAYLDLLQGIAYRRVGLLGLRAPSPEAPLCRLERCRGHAGGVSPVGRAQRQGHPMPDV
jgi:hypothetical protein